MTRQLCMQNVKEVLHFFYYLIEEKETSSQKLLFLYLLPESTAAMHKLFSSL